MNQNEEIALKTGDISHSEHKGPGSWQSLTWQPSGERDLIVKTSGTDFSSTLRASPHVSREASNRHFDLSCVTSVSHG